MSRHLAVRLAVAGVLVAAACSGGEDGASPVTTARPDAPPGASTTEATDTSSRGDGSEPGTEPTAETTAPPTSEPTTSEVALDDSTPDPMVPAEGLRAQLHKEEGGDLIDPCGVFELGRPAITDPPVAFVGFEFSYGDPNAEYWVGSAPSWCVYDFEVGAPINVVVTAPDGTAASHELRLDLSGQPCSWRCDLDDSLVVGVASGNTPLAVRTLVAERVDGVLGGWIPPHAPTGRYVVEATQVSPSTGTERTSRSEFVVIPSPRPGLPVVSPDDGDHGRAPQMFVVGHPPDTVVRPGLFVSDPKSCDTPECEGVVGPSWRFVRMLEDVEVDGRGEAIVQINGAALPPGEYCIMTPQTIPQIAGERTLDPCFLLSGFPAAFSRSWLALDSTPELEVLVTGDRGGAALERNRRSRRTLGHCRCDR